MTDYSIAQQSYQGGRDYNEDRTAIFKRDNALLLIVADGLGGHAGGAVASQAFVDALGASFSSATEEQLQDAENFLSLSINYAHHMIHRRAVSKGYPSESPKTTCVVCLIYNGEAQWAHSGDSRLYLIRKREIIERTEDHISDKVSRSGNSPLNRCVGGVELPRPEVSLRHQVEYGDVFVLASDGAWACLKPEDLREYIDSEHPTFGIDGLLRELENRNKTPSDNLSLVILFWGVKQLDQPIINELPAKRITPDPSRKRDGIVASAFDMADLDDTISDIESFITQIDEKL